MPDRSAEDEAEALRLQHSMAAAGFRLGVTWRAASDHLASIIGFAAHDVRHAGELCDQAAEDMKASIRRNWQEIRAARGRSARRHD